MKIHHYDETTGAYLGEGLADESPLEPGHFLVPAHATPIAPPEAAEGERPFWTGAAWELRPETRSE